MIPERPVFVGLPAGARLKGAVALPAGARSGVVVCHPHPRYGGDMDSTIVVAAADACRRQGLATLRFNFRGVGRSSGAWDEGRGEQDDLRAALAHLRALLGRSDGVALAGYSFGAAMAMAVVRGGEPVAGLALIAPPLASAAWDAPAPPAVDGPTLVVAGSEDTHCPPGALGAGMPRATVRVIDRADHFFHSGHAALVIALTDWAAALAAA